MDPQGNVVAAKPDDGPAEGYTAAVAEAMKWKYIPFEKEGVAVIATITDYARILPPEDLPKTHQAFPSVNSLNGVVMTLSRSQCFGSCPSYRVEIHGDGSVRFEGKAFVVVEGQHRDHLSAGQVSEIVEAFRKADYFSLRDEYRYPVTDCPTYETSFAADRVSKKVADYVGEEQGMPQAVSDLEETIDRVVGTLKWVRGNEETVPALKREGWDLKSEETGKILGRASRDGSVALVRDLLAEGVGLSASDENGNSALALAAFRGDRATVKMLVKAGADKNDPEMKSKALAGAARAGDMELVRLLLDYGASAKSVAKEDDRSATVLMWAATSAVPEVVEAILSAHPEVNARDEKGRTAVRYICDANSGNDEKRHADRGKVVHLLARAGADLNAQDEEGNAPLHEAYDLETARALIQDGANVDIRNADGETPLMTNFSVGVAKLLVAAGADIHARDHDGGTALDAAIHLEPNGERAQFLKSLSADKDKP